MKKSLLFLYLLLPVAFAYGQIEQGTHLISGSVFLKNATMKDLNGSQKNTSFNASARYGHFLIDNFALGAAINYRTGVSGNGVGFGIGVRKYFELHDQLYVYSEAIVYRSTDQNIISYSSALSPGISFFVSDKIALESSLGTISYMFWSSKSDEIDTSGQTFGAGFRSNVSLGLYFYF